MEALKVEKLSKEFGGVRAVHDVSFCVQEGEHLAIIGPNGAGKTTLFNLLSGQLSPSGGKVYFFEQDITHMATHRRAHLGISRSFQLVSLFMNLTVLDRVEVCLNGEAVESCNPLVPGHFDPLASSWQTYDLTNHLPVCGDNEIRIRAIERNPRLAAELPLEVTDIELKIEYDFPNGPWRRPPGFASRSGQAH